MLNAYFLRHKPQQQVDIIALTQQQRQLGLLKRVQKPFGEFFSLNRDNADGGVFGDCTAEYRHQYGSRKPPSGGSGPGIETEIEGRSYIGYASKMYRLVMMGASNIHQQLFGCGAGNGVVIGRDSTVECDRG